MCSSDLEVSVLRRALESLPAAWQANQAPDYTPTLSAISKRLQEVVTRLQAIEGHPALRMTPEHHQHAMAQAGSAVMHDAVSRLEAASQGMQQRAKELAGIIGSARNRREQLKWLVITGAAVLLIGLLCAPFVARLLPFGLDGRVAATIMGTDRWQAGGKLMAAASPAAWRDLSIAAGVLEAKKEALALCRDAAARAKKEQRCTVTVPAP